MFLASKLLDLSNAATEIEDSTYNIEAQQLNMSVRIFILSSIYLFSRYPICKACESFKSIIEVNQWSFVGKHLQKALTGISQNKDETNQMQPTHQKNMRNKNCQE